MRIARFSLGSEPAFGIIEGPEGSEVITVIEGDPLIHPAKPTGTRVPLAEVKLLAPVIPRSKVVAIGKNYAEHAAEMGGEAPTEPLFFLKPNTSVIGPNDAIQYPPQTSNLHYEAELAVVIGRLCRDVPAQRAHEVIFGYTCANDVTARDLQAKDGQWTRAKGFDTFCPLGPWIETELDTADLAVTCAVNGQVRQSGRTARMIHDIPKLIEYVSSVMTLLPADVLLTGTPAGVGPLQVGDEVAVTVEGLGTLTNTVVRRG